MNNRFSSVKQLDSLMTPIQSKSLNSPPSLNKGVLRIITLGGLGEIGRNMTVFEIDNQLLVIDCGILFPESTQPGVDLILPDFSYIENRMDNIVAIVLTHGHEDHIGAVPYLLRYKNDIPLIGSKLTLALIESKLREHKIKPYTFTVKEGDTEKLGPFLCNFIAVNHSIPDALAVFIKTKAGNVLHTGDFKMDQLPLDGRITDLRAFSRAGEQGVDLFMSDSTNADIPGFTTMECEIGPVLNNLFAEASKRIIVASFASHIHRVQQVLDAAHAHNRKVAFIGRSMVRNMKIASDLGYLKIPNNTLIDMKKIDNYSSTQTVLMCTGSQGEPMAALSRMANGEHAIDVGHNDTVILASSLIPGNETAVFKIINDLMQLGASVIHKGIAKVHVSGHASAGELIYCYNIIKPKAALPIHGEIRHLVANGNIAKRTGINPNNIFLIENGVTVDMIAGNSNISGGVAVNYIYVDGKTVGKITDNDLRDRRILRDEGFLSVIMVIQNSTGKIVSGPEIHSRGFAEGDTNFLNIESQLKKVITDSLSKGMTDINELQQVLQKVLGSWVFRTYRRRPMIIAIIKEA